MVVVVLASDIGFIAIVDDESDISNLFCDALARMKAFSIFKFTDPLVALEHFKTHVSSYILIIADFRMPGLNGMELLKKVKE